MREHHGQTRNWHKANGCRPTAAGQVICCRWLNFQIVGNKKIGSKTCKESDGLGGLFKKNSINDYSLAAIVCCRWAAASAFVELK